MADVQSTTSSKIQTSSAAKSKLKFGSDFETFLKLLVTQLKNQDPLSPLKSHEFTNQLVMFAGVEQQIRGNELKEQLVEAESRRVLTDGLNLIDKKVSYGNSLFEFDEKGRIFFEFSSPGDMKNVRLQVYDDKDSFLTQLSTGEVKSGKVTHIWDGKVLAADGVTVLKQLDRGSYKLKVLDATSPDGRVVDGSKFSVENVRSGLVRGITIKNGKAYVKLNDDKLVGIANVGEIHKDDATDSKTSLDVAEDLNRASSLIGRTVVYRSSTVPLEGGSAKFSYKVPGAANTGKVYVTNLEGRLMYIDELPLTVRADGKPQDGSYTWDGTSYKYDSDGKRVMTKDADGKDTSVPELETAADGEYIFYINGLKDSVEGKSYTRADVEYQLPIREGKVTGAEVLEGKSVVLKVGTIPVLLEGLVRVQDGPTPTPPSPSPSLYSSVPSF
jgi:flagellar basal-body rod modification protein FlgD